MSSDSPTDPDRPDSTNSIDLTDPIRLAFVCVQNAGRSQMAAAFAERERDRRGLDERVEILTGGTDPAEDVHDEVVAVMNEIDVDLADRTPREISTDTLRSCDVVVTMGCTTLDLGAVANDGKDAEDGEDADVDSAVDVRDWALDDPDGQDPEEVRRIRDEIERKVAAVFDDVRTAEAESDS